MVQRELLAAIKQRLTEHYGDRLKGVILYGSEARGDADDDSDVDLLVLLEGPIATFKEIRAIVKQIYPLLLDREFFRSLEALPVNVDDYENISIGFYGNVKQEGIPL